MRIRKILLLGLVLAELLVVSSIFVFDTIAAPTTTVIEEWTGLKDSDDVAIGDYNNDGSNDLAFTEYQAPPGTPNVKVYASDGTTIIKQWQLTAPLGVAIGDYNNDGSSDIAITHNGLGMVTVYASDGSTIIRQWTGLAEAWGVAIGDYNNDGSNDIAIPELMADKVTVYASDGTIIKELNAGIYGPYAVAIGDYNNDGLNDLAISKWWTVTVYSEIPTIGGVWVPVDKFGLVAPYIGLASTIVAATAATAICVKRARRRKDRR